MMLKSETCFCFFAFIVIAPFEVSAMTAEQKAKIHEHFEEFGMQCIQEYTITEQDILDLRAHKVAGGENVPCFLACMMKKVGVMNDKGMLESETALEHAKKVFDDEEEVQRIGEFLHSCSHINKEAVSDGEKGCDRAVPAFKCMIENASQFGLDI